MTNIAKFRHIFHCFPNILFSHDEWSRQVIKVGKQFWVFPGGMLGSVQANDAANCLVESLVLVFQKKYKIDCQAYVDNFQLLIPNS